MCSLFPSPRWPTDRENRYDVRHLLFHLDNGISWPGDLISPTFAEAINTSPSSSVRLPKEHTEKSEKELRGSNEMALFVVHNKP